MKTAYETITTAEGKGLETQVVETMQTRGLKITTAESCTGGLICATLVNVPGASDVLDRAFVTYADAAKAEELFVKQQTLDKHGAVSKQTVKQMARGAAAHAKADAAIAVTGIAGPGGGTEEKPVGLVYIGIFYQDRVYWQAYQFSGTRLQIRKQTVVNSLYMLLQILQGNIIE